MEDWLNRTRILLGEGAIRRLAGARVYVFGLGAVGSYAVEALARCGVGFLRLVDFDAVKASNINRQLFATHDTLGRPKAELAAERVRSINPAAVAEPVTAFAHVETLPGLLSGEPDVVVDAVDSLNPKTEIIAAALGMGTPVYSSMGAATRLDADAIRFGPLFAARGCPLGRMLRKRLRRRGMEGGEAYCVYSEEPRRKEAVLRPGEDEGEYERGRRRDVLGSIATITGMFGLRLGHEAALRLAGREGR